MKNEETMKKEELTPEQMEESNGGMYQGYGGVERPGIMSKGMGPGMLPRGPGMMGPSYYNTPQYIPETTPPSRKVPPHGGMGTGFMGPGINNYYIG